MFKSFFQAKSVQVSVALLIAAGAIFFFVQSSAKELATNGFFHPSSTLSNQSGQESEGVSNASAWPPLLIEGSAGPVAISSAGRGSGEVSKELEESLRAALVQLGLASTSEASTPSVSSAVPAASVTWCDFSASGPGGDGIIFNEIAWMGSENGPNDEWMEIRNISGRNVPLGGWQILNKSGGIKISFSATTTMAADSLLLLRRNENYSGPLNNAGDWLKIFNSDCEISDEINFSSAWPGGDNATKKTLERSASVNEWHTSANVGGSPGAENSEPAPAAQNSPETNSTTTSPTSTSTQSSVTQPTSTTQSIAYPLARVLLHSIGTTGGTGLSDEDYVKIFNPSVGSVDVSGWNLRKRTQSGTESSVKVFPEQSTIAPSGYFVWANSANGFSSKIGANVSSTQILSADNSIALFNASGTLVDALAWGSGHSTPYIEGQAYPENPGPNQALSRKSEGGALKDSGNNAQDFELR